MSDRDQEVIKQYFILAKLEVFYQLLKWGCRDGSKTIDKCPCYQSQLKLVNSWVKWLFAWSFLIVLSIWHLFCIVNRSLTQWQDNAEKSQTDFVLPFWQKQSTDGFLDWARHKFSVISQKEYIKCDIYLLFSHPRLQMMLLWLCLRFNMIVHISQRSTVDVDRQVDHRIYRSGSPSTSGGA